MNRSVGERLRAERERRELSVEEVARLTRMRPEQIRDLEDNDYGNFPSLVYAKSFLKLYGKFLKVDLTEAYEFFGPEPSTFESSGLFREPLATLDGGRRGSAPGRRIPASRRSAEGNKSGPGILFWALGILLLGGTLLAAKVAIDLGRLSTSAGETVQSAFEDPSPEGDPPAASGPLRSPTTVPAVEAQEAEPVATAEPVDPSLRRPLPQAPPESGRNGNLAR